MSASQYENSLIAMHRLLSAFDIHRWADWIHEDIESWRVEHRTEHHLAAYGGMGSFNDIIICGVNGHDVKLAREPWVNSLFEWLKSACYRFALEPQRQWSAIELQNEIGRYDAALAAFVGGDKSPDSMREFCDHQASLTGWRCLQCAYSEVRTSDLETFIARLVLPSEIFLAAEKCELVELVDKLLKVEPPQAQRLRIKLKESLSTSDISIVVREGWMRPCPSCKSDNTSVYRWIYVESETFTFKPSSENLPMAQSPENPLRLRKKTD